MNIDKLTIGEVKTLRGMFQADNMDATPYTVGDKVLIRTVTMTQTGRIIKVTPGELVLEDAAWIADTGRFSEALKTGKLNEVEPADGLVIISRGAIVDVYEWNHELPREVK